MCGRTALTLDPATIAKACAQKRTGRPVWKDEPNLGKKYEPSLNTAPTDVTPVLLYDSKNSYEYTLKPMMWGIVPPWHKGSYKSHGLSTNNCRIENVLSSKLYCAPLREGKRCVVVVEGFYEWSTVDKAKQPYYIYSPQDGDTKIYDSSTWNNTLDEDEGWKGVKLLKMAAVYDVWHSDEGSLYCYSIITMESGDSLKWLHHRTPAILETEEEILNWLDVGNVSYRDSVNNLKIAPSSALAYHAVSKSVNNSRFKESSCNKPSSCVERKRTPLDAWLSGASKKTKIDG